MSIVQNEDHKGADPMKGRRILIGTMVLVGLISLGACRHVAGGGTGALSYDWPADVPDGRDDPSDDSGTGGNGRIDVSAAAGAAAPGSGGEAAAPPAAAVVEEALAIEEAEAIEEAAPIEPDVGEEVIVEEEAPPLENPAQEVVGPTEP